jgi:hypothetical protein
MLVFGLAWNTIYYGSSWYGSDFHSLQTVPFTIGLVQTIGIN